MFIFICLFLYVYFYIYVYFYVIVYISKPASIIIITTNNGIQESDKRVKCDPYRCCN